MSTENREPVSRKAKKSAFKLLEIRTRFADWLATPPSYRRPATARGFAERYGVHEVTLSKWRTDPDVLQSAKQLIRVHALSRYPDVIDAITEMAIHGNLDAARLYMEHIVGWQSKNSRKRRTRARTR